MHLSASLTWKASPLQIRESNQGRNQVVVATPGLLDGGEARPFWATANDGLVVVGRGNVIGQDEFMRWQDPVAHDPVYVGVMDGWGATGDWSMCHAGWNAPPPSGFAADTPAPPPDRCPDDMPTAFTTYKFNLDPSGAEDGLRDWQAANSVQLSEVTLYDVYGDALLDGLTCTNPDGNNPGGELPEHACDGVTAEDPGGCSGCANTGHKWLDFNKGDLVLTFTRPQQVGSYDWQTANDVPARDPTKWALEGSNDGNSWFTLDATNARTTFATTAERFTWQGPFAVACEPSVRAGGCSGSFSIAVDNAYALYINGQYQSNVNGGATNVAGCDQATNPSGDPYTGCNWQSIDLHEFNNIPGPVTFAVDALDAGGIGGWIGTAVVNGVTYDSTPNSAWRCTSGDPAAHGQDGGWSQVNPGWHGDPPPYGWARSHFDDSDWRPPTSIGAYDSGPWNIQNNQGSLGTLSPSSQWLWTEDADQHNDIYCRLTVQCGRPQPPAPPAAQAPRTMEGATAHAASSFEVTGNAQIQGDVISVTQVANSQQGTAFKRMDIDVREPFTLGFEMYCGDGSGADGLCANVGNNDLGGRVGENGVTEGVALCFDEWANGGDHGVAIYYNAGSSGDGDTSRAGEIWANIGLCGNRENCVPVSLFDDATWHVVELNISPSGNSGAVVTFDFDSGAYGGFALIDSYALPRQPYVGFSGRTGGATNNHWVRAVSTGGAWVLPPPPPPPPPLPVSIEASAFELAGSAQLDRDVLSITQLENSQQGTAFYRLGENVNAADFKFTTRFDMYCGDGSGADGLCVNIGANDLVGRVGEDGVATGVAVCFDEWANDGDHGVSIFYNAQQIWENIAPCDNRDACIPVSLYDDAAWHSVEVDITPLLDGSAEIRFSLDNGLYSGFGNVNSYLGSGFSLPAATYLGFSGRTGGATNNHWVRHVMTTNPPPPPYTTSFSPGQFALSGSARVQGEVLQITQVANSQTGTAFAQTRLSSRDAFALRYWIYTGDGSGADGQCASVGNNDLGGRVGENGVTQGIALCFDEWANGGDHGVAIYYNAGSSGDGDTSRAGAIWENIAPCGNRENCVPVSLFDDAAWHVIDLAVQPSGSGAGFVFNMDNGVYGGFGTVSDWALPSPAYLGFTARTGGATNNHWVRGITLGDARDAAVLTATLPENRADFVPAEALANQLNPSQFTLGGSARLDDGGVISVTQTENSQTGTAFSRPMGISSSRTFSLQFAFYCGDGSGADGLCANVGGNDLGGRVGEDGVAQGVAVCFDEWANNGDHGVSIFYNGGMIWENIGSCGNREACVPVSLFDDSTWHQVKVDILPSRLGNAAQVRFDFDGGTYGGFGDISNFALPSPNYVGFTGRTGGATNNHWVRDISTSAVAPPPPPERGNPDCSWEALRPLRTLFCPRGGVELFQDDRVCATYTNVFRIAADNNLGPCATWQPDVMEGAVAQLPSPLPRGQTLEGLCPVSCGSAASLTIPSGNNAGSTCPMNCASRILPWATQCASDPQFQQMDSTNLLTNFRAMCMSTMAGGQNQAGGSKDRPPAGGGH